MWKKVLLTGVMATMMMGANAMAASTLTMDGSTSVYPLANLLATGYNTASTSQITFNIKQSDSGSGIKLLQVAAPTIDIANASRDLTDAESATGLVSTKIAKDAVVMIVNPANPVKNLTAAQITGIYNGTYTNWNQVGGRNATIVVNNREAGSGTLDCFTKTITGTITTPSSVLVANGSPAMLAAISGTANANAIGYVSMGLANSNSSTVKSLTLNSITASATTVNDSTYKAQRNFNMITKGAPSATAQLFINYILSPAGQTIVQNDGEVTIASTTLLKKTLSTTKK
jgi:phosphate transport system substrate-binding protein